MCLGVDWSKAERWGCKPSLGLLPIWENSLDFHISGLGHQEEEKEATGDKARDPGKGRNTAGGEAQRQGSILVGK